ncbi:MIP family protein [Hyphomicrobium nitrativorans NL23]|uniref:MIP family protein n=1 Tax=Hyphomicrobium nitrativorans NL23 TaxID=1029756 RepID=V5SGS5_9HYPH|nr:MIP/aquaporin family protein [Hyphomicrobium nitrativorans]AHB49733.1 MIP family protein [Hyphomicrobium nitrativorans NL23]
MSASSLREKFVAEALGAGFLLAAIVGSGLMAERLAGGNAALALLGNTLPTGAMLVVLITMLAPISGAHINPAVSLAFFLRRELTGREFLAYAAAQLGGAVAGVLIAHAMFDAPLLQVSATTRSGFAQTFSEGVATFGLVLTILLTLRARPQAVAVGVGLYITAAFWFTASTSFANPAVTIARTLTDSFAGIRPDDVPGFLLAQVVGTVSALMVLRALAPGSLRQTEPARLTID